MIVGQAGSRSGWPNALHSPVGSHGVSGKMLVIDVDFNPLPSWSWLDP